MALAVPWFRGLGLATEIVKSSGKPPFSQNIVPFLF
jgi:hypothetical protein